MQASGLTIAGGSAAFISACGGSGGAPSSPQGVSDARILNSGRTLALSTAAAYAQTAPLLRGPARQVAVQFQAQAKAQATVLGTSVEGFGATPVRPKTSAEYARQLGISTLKDEAAALRFLSELETAAIGAYEHAVPKLTNTELRGAFAQIATCDAEHLSVLVGLQTGNDPAKQAPQAFVTGPAVAAD